MPVKMNPALMLLGHAIRACLAYKAFNVTCQSFHNDLLQGLAAAAAALA